MFLSANIICFANENLEGISKTFRLKLLHKAAKNVLQKAAKCFANENMEVISKHYEKTFAQFSKIKKGGFHRLLEIFIFKYFLCFALFQWGHLLCEGLIG